MELSDLESGLKSIASGGNVVNCQELVGLQAGLTSLKSQQKSSEIFFWGKIFGEKADYYIAYSIPTSAEDFEFPAKVFYYAGDDYEFQVLERLTEQVAAQVLEKSQGRKLTGKADELLEKAAEGEEPPAEEGEAVADKPKPLTEVQQLSYTVQEIDFDTAVVPRGAHALNEAHSIVRSQNFKGLGQTESTLLSKYVHFRPPASVASLKALARTDALFFADFLDPVDGDLPQGCWAVRQDAAATLVTLRSLSWPGYMAFHVPGTTKFGGAYFGYAQKNQDLPFLL